MNEFPRSHPLANTPPHPSGMKALAGLSLHEDRRLAPYFHAANDLLEFLHTTKPPQGVSGDKDPLLWTSLYRSMKTHRAALVLCDAGFGEQAGMLCRSLFEDLLVTHWIGRTEGRELRRLFLEHADRVSLADRETLAEHERLDELALVPAMSEERLAELEASGGSKGAFRTWHGQKLRELLEALKSEFDPGEASLLDAMHDLAYRLQNLILHHSPRSFEFTVGVALSKGALPPETAAAHGKNDAPLATISSRPGVGYVEEALRAEVQEVPRLVTGVRANDACSSVDGDRSAR